jgi:hypothetical protein
MGKGSIQVYDQGQEPVPAKVDEVAVLRKMGRRVKAIQDLEAVPAKMREVAPLRKMG